MSIPIRSSAKLQLQEFIHFFFQIAVTIYEILWLTIIPSLKKFFCTITEKSHRDFNDTLRLCLQGGSVTELGVLTIIYGSTSASRSLKFVQNISRKIVAVYL